MKRKSLMQVLFTLLIGVLSLAWVGSVTGMPGMTGMWQGFHADEKGFPGWNPNDQQRIPGQQNGKLSDEGVELRTLTDEGAPYAPYDGFNGAQQGNFPGGRPGR